MQKRIIRLITWLVLVLMSVQVVLYPSPLLAQAGAPFEDPVAQPFAANSNPIPPFAPGVVLVGVRGDVTAAAAMPWGEVEVLGVEALPLHLEAVSAAGEASGPLTGYKLTVPVGTEWGAVETLAARGDVAFAEPDWLVQMAQSDPDNDPANEPESAEAVDPDLAVAEVPFAIVDTLYDEQWYMQRIGISRAWADALVESQGVLNTINVVVIDTGVDYTHPDLADRVNEGHNYVDSTKTAHDDNGHGTHVSGLVAAAVNGAGTVGPGLQVEITPFKALNANGTGFVSSIAQALEDAADDGADIINMSLQLSFDSFVLRAAVQYAVNEGVLLIAASGNQGSINVSYPAAYPAVMAVGATSYYDARTYYSNRGPELDIMAPGGLTANSILSTWTRDVGATCPSGLREVNGGVYCNAEGTSMATGIATGAAALIMSMRPDLDADEVQAILLDSAAPINGTAEEVGRGRLDVANAVRLALAPRLVYPDAAATASALDGQMPFTVTLPLTNPSLVPLSVDVTPTVTTTWYALVGPRMGDVSYGKPLELQLVFTPTAVSTGEFQSSLRVSSTVAGGSTSVYFIDTRLNVYPTMVGASRLYVAWLAAPETAFTWAEPNGMGRTNYAIGNGSSIVVDLPFTMTVRGKSHTDLRIFADGFVVAPASAFPTNLPNQCLANQTWPAFAAYGWWSDLTLAVDSSLSTFQPDADHFVIEYDRFASAGSSDPADRVHFQIVLDREGRIAFNYDQIPEHLPTSLTVGASVADGRYFNQVTCHQTGSMQIGEIPQDHQSFNFQVGDLY